MSRNITVTFEDGTTHTYQNAPDDLTPAQVEQRAMTDFKKKVAALDGGRSAQVAPESPAPTAPQRSLGQEALRQAGLTGRYAVEGLTDLAGLVSEPIRALGEAAGLPATPSLREGVSGGLTALGVPNPETGTERVVGDVSRALAGGGAVVKGAQVLSKVPGAVQGLATELARAPGTQAAAITGGAAAGGAAREGGAGPGGQLAASVLGSFIPLTPGAMATGSGWVMDAARGRLVEMRAGRILREVAGDRLDDIKTLLRKAGASDADITAAQATVDANAPTWQALGYTARAKSPEQYAALEESQKLARRQALTDVTPNREAAVQARGRTKDILYGAAEAGDVTRLAAIADDAQRIRAMGAGGAAGSQPIPTPVTPRLEALRQNPVIADVVDAVRRSDPGLGDPLASLAGLQKVKLLLDDQFKSKTPVSAWGRLSEKDKLSTKGALLKAMEEVSPTYDIARRRFAEQSQPINQADVLGEMSSILMKPTGEENVTSLLTALGRGENALLKRSTGFPRYNSLDEVLTPQQSATVQRVENELVRDRLGLTQARAGETRLREIIGESNVIPQVPNPLRVEVSILNRVLEGVKGRVNQRTNDMLLQAMRRPEDALRLLEMVPAADRNTVLQAIRQAQGPAMATNALIGASQANSVPVTP